MPRLPRKPCSQPGCDKTTAKGGACEEHERQRNQLRAEPGMSARGKQWARRRKAFIYQHPWCVLCGKAAVVADHWPKSRKQLISEGVADPDSAKHLRPLCVLCHNRSTARCQPGGFTAEARSNREAAQREVRRWTGDDDLPPF